MVTLNGRTMPGSALPGGGGAPNSRAFDFSDLASESVRAVEVYKTGRASIATGGIGASINCDGQILIINDIHTLTLQKLIIIN